jgi:hypothetical protein
VFKIGAATLAMTLAGAACSGSTPDAQSPDAPSTPPAVVNTADTGASELRATLTAALQEHEYLAGIGVFAAVKTGADSGVTGAALGALGENTQALRDAIGSIYGADAGAAFEPLWETHIGFFVDYTMAKATGDAAKARKARKDLDAYRADFGAFLASANPNLTTGAVADALIPHVASTLAAIDAVVAGDGDAFAKLRSAASKLPPIAEVLAGAISAQFPETFGGDASSGGAGLRSTLTAGLQEHEYTAGIAFFCGVNFGLDSAEFGAGADVLDANSRGLADAIGSVYGDAAGKAFLPLWRKHIGFFVDYTTASTTGDDAGMERAREALDGYRGDFGAFLASANPTLTKDAVADALIPHVASTLAAIDAVVAKDASQFSKVRIAAGHMPGIAGVLAGAIAAQFPERF